MTDVKFNGDWKSECLDLRDQLAEVTKQRDELANYLDDMVSRYKGQIDNTRSYRPDKFLAAESAIAALAKVKELK